MESASSSFMFVFRENTPESYAKMSTEQRRQCLQDWNSWCTDLAARGKLQQGSPLFPEGKVVSRSGGRVVVDGPYAEAKELIGGYFIVNAADLEEAAAMAEECPNLKHGMAVEVRPVAQACHLARSLGYQTMEEALAV